jgi:hypothetical protein
MTELDMAAARLALAVDGVRLALMSQDSAAQVLLSASVAAVRSELEFAVLWQRVSRS